MKGDGFGMQRLVFTPRMRSAAVQIANLAN